MEAAKGEFEIEGIGRFTARRLTAVGVRQVLEELTNAEALSLFGTIQEVMQNVDESQPKDVVGKQVLALLNEKAMTSAAQFGILWTKIAPCIFCAVAQPAEETPDVPVDEETGLVSRVWAVRNLPIGAELTALTAAHEAGTFKYIARQVKNLVAPLLTAAVGKAETKPQSE